MDTGKNWYIVILANSSQTYIMKGIGCMQRATWIAHSRPQNSVVWWTWEKLQIWLKFTYQCYTACISFCKSLWSTLYCYKCLSEMLEINTYILANTFPWRISVLTQIYYTAWHLFEMMRKKDVYKCKMAHTIHLREHINLYRYVTGNVISY